MASDGREGHRPASRRPTAASRTSSVPRPPRPRWRRRPSGNAPRTVKSNPDSPQLPVRVRALVDGKLVYMAVPRLAERDPFFVLDPARLADPPRQAATIKRASRSARTVAARGDGTGRPRRHRMRRRRRRRRAARQGRRLQRSRARARSAARDSSTPARSWSRRCTTCRCRPAGVIPTTRHDIHVDLIVTPTRICAAEARPRASATEARLDSCSPTRRSPRFRCSACSGP